jgi:hypothetical protein
MAVALDIASPASAAADKRIAIGFPIEASIVELVMQGAGAGLNRT